MINLSYHMIQAKYLSKQTGICFKKRQVEIVERDRLQAIPDFIECS